MMKCTEVLIEDHVILRRGLDILDRMCQIMEAGDRIEVFDIRTVLKFLRTFGEDPLYQRLLQDHREERELVSAIESTLNSRHGIGFVRSSRRLILLLRNHLDREDTVLCDIAERLLSSEEDERIAAEFRTRQSYLESFPGFDRLERKYAPKPRGSRIELDRRAHA